MKETQPLRGGEKKNDPTPQRRLEGTSIQSWMDDRHICAYQDVVWYMGEVLEPGALSKALYCCDGLKHRVVDVTQTPLVVAIIFF